MGLLRILLTVWEQGSGDNAPKSGMRIAGTLRSATPQKAAVLPVRESQPRLLASEVFLGNAWIGPLGPQYHRLKDAR